MCVITGIAALVGALVPSLTVAGAVSSTAAAVGGTLGLVGAEVGLAAGIAGTVTGIQQGEQQRAQSEFMAQQERQNALLAEQQAQDIEEQGNLEFQNLQKKMLATRSTGRTAYASNNVILGSGTVLDYEADIADAYDLDRRNLDYDIKSKSWQKRVEAVNYRNQAAMYDAQADAYKAQRVPSLLTGMFNTVSGSMSGATAGAKLDKNDKLGGFLKNIFA